ncbi:MAG: putative DNA binding domain-containing protein [Phycisphaerae bacterium]|nr:putative DNA binding domain-containing protein [Phycisphaerae bacterium]
MSDAELEKLLNAGESGRIERKESLAGDVPNKLRQAICAFSNDLPRHELPGIAFVGVRDDGSSASLQITDDVLAQLASLKDDGNIVPPPSMTVEKRRLRGADVAVLTVLPSDSPPVRYRGEIWIRTGPRRGRATAPDERILNERRRSGNAPFDLSAVRAVRVTDLDRRSFESEYLPSAFAREVLDANERSYEQRLAATKMVVSDGEPTPTVLGALVLCPRTRDFIPGACIQFLRIAGDDLSDPIRHEQLIDGTPGDMARRLDEKVAAHNSMTVDLVSGAVERRRSSYPIAAIQKLARNSVMHRTYEATNAPIRFTWYDDRIELTSPGGPFGSVNAKNFGSPGVTDY